MGSLWTGSLIIYRSSQARIIQQDPESSDSGSSLFGFQSLFCTVFLFRGIFRNQPGHGFIHGLGNNRFGQVGIHPCLQAPPAEQDAAAAVGRPSQQIITSSPFTSRKGKKANTGCRLKDDVIDELNKLKMDHGICFHPVIPFCAFSSFLLSYICMSALLNTSATV